MKLQISWRRIAERCSMIDTEQDTSALKVVVVDMDCEEVKAGDRLLRQRA